jgi:hypothetical protein
MWPFSPGCFRHKFVPAGDRFMGVYHLVWKKCSVCGFRKGHHRSEPFPRWIKLTEFDFNRLDKLAELEEQVKMKKETA